MFLQSCRWKWKEILPETFLSYRKGISLMDVFIILQLSNDFRVRKKRGKQNYYKKRKQIRYLNIFNIINILTLLSADAKSAILLRVPSLTKVEELNFTVSRCYIFPDGSVWLMDNLLCLCDVWKGQPCVNSTASASSIFNNGHFCLKYYFLHHRNPPTPLKRFS